MNTFWLYALLSIAFLFDGAAYAIPPTIPEPPHDPLFKALEGGNAVSVHRIEIKEGAGPGMRAMDHAQLDYDIPRLMTAALHCQGEVMKGGTVDDLATALYCSYVARSSALIEGNALAYLQEVQWVRNTLYPAIKRVANDNPVFGTELDSVNPRQLTRTTPAITEAWLSGSQELSFQAFEIQPEYTDTSPVIHVKINGQRIAASIEMGRGTLRTPITIIEPGRRAASISSKLKLKLIVQDYVHAFVRYGEAKYQITPSLYLADEVRVGPLMLHHVAVDVITANFVQPGVYLSKSLWRRFGEVTISGTSIRLSRQSTHQCAPVVPMTFAANYHEIGSLQFPIGLNSAARIAGLSLRATDPVDIDSIAWTGTRPHTADAGAWKSRMVKGPITIQVGHQSFSVPSAYIETGWHEPFQVSLGRSILDKYTVHLQLSGGTSSICLAPNQGDASGRTH